METDQLEVTPEQLNAAKETAIAIIAEQNKSEERKSPWIAKAIKWFYTTLIRPLCQIIFTGVKDTVTFIINNAENQNLAKLAITTAAQAGLKGNAAWTAAMAIFKAGQICIATGKYIKGSELATNIRETILQIVYTCLRNSAQGRILLKCSESEEDDHIIASGSPSELDPELAQVALPSFFGDGED